MRNEMKLEFSAFPQNEAFARVAVAAFMTGLDPTIEQMEDVKTAVSEAVTNCIIHGYEITQEELEKNEAKASSSKVMLLMSIERDEIRICVKDEGIGIENIRQAMEPMYTSKPHLERSGMGFAFMEAFMDGLEVHSVPGRGTTVSMYKQIAKEEGEE